MTLMQSLIQLFKRFSTDDSIFRIILTAEGKYFCTGMDLKGPGTAEERFDNLKELFNVIDNCPKTTIAAVNGPCLGGGVGLAFVCDIRLLTFNATFRLSEVRLGLCPATISKYIIREWGFAFARTAILTAREVSPLELAALQIIHKIVTDKAALELELDFLLDEMRQVAPQASALSKRLVTSAWVNAGGKDQDRVIQESFAQMMAVGSESTYALKEFRKGIREIDWERLLRQPNQSKL